MKQEPYNKPALTIQQQIDQLHKRGMVINEPAKAAHYLKQISYYRLTAYWLPYESDHASHNFHDGITFEKVLDLYIFDRGLRLLIMDAIERIEVAIRAQLAFQLGHHHGSHPHLNTALFKSAKNNWNYTEQLKLLSKAAHCSQEVFIQHFLSKYSEPLPPIWAVVEILTLGQLSKWYANLKSGADRNLIAHVYDCDEANLTSFLHHLTTMRNLCAHHSRLWNREFTFALKLPRKRPKMLLSSFNPNKPRHIYNTLVMIKYLMDQIAPGHHWQQRLNDMLDRHHINTEYMGFPVDWKMRTIWKK